MSKNWASLLLENRKAAVHELVVSTCKPLDLSGWTLACSFQIIGLVYPLLTSVGVV